MSFRGGRGLPPSSNVYVGNLPPYVREGDLEEVFDAYGHIVKIELKTMRGPPFAFIEFEDPRDAEDAVHDGNRLVMEGFRLKVEFPKGPFNSRGRGGFRGGFAGRGPPRRSMYRVTVTDLPPSGSWQDLKDHMREAGDVLFTDVDSSCRGIVEFEKADAMNYAIRNLDGSRFTSHEGEESYITVKEVSDDGFRSSSRHTSSYDYRSRSRSCDRYCRTPLYSPRRTFRQSRSRSRSWSGSPYRR
ncbi:serine/arginine-rich splicing factor 1-like [Lineus longissimus]|uniref:serine/arginine-rich splicing factor 1-like n=1 Tax=Lineus longissimus TaxID=88925 RepID=UPI002B4CF517